MISLTFLKPVEKWAFTSKIYKQSDANLPPEKVSDYKLGKLYTFNHYNVESLFDVYLTLQEHKEGYIRVNGAPKPGLLPNAEIPRDNEHFPEMDSELLLLDLDKWRTEKRWDLNDSATTHENIKEILKAEGFEWLTNSQFICLLTSSVFSSQFLSCHLYFHLSEPIHISAVREWLLALEHTKKKSIFDKATAKSSQPDYIGARKCLNFHDPIRESGRLSICLAGEERLDSAVLQQHMDNMIAAAGWEGLNSIKVKLGDNWLDTLSFAGRGDYGINEVCHRAAAQLVHEIGKQKVVENANHYITEMHRIAWERIYENDPYGKGYRDNAADLQTYKPARFKQYVLSACGKTFGDTVDSLRATVKGAIEKAANGDIQVMYDQPVMSAYLQLRAQHPGAFAEVRTLLKKSLKGDISISGYEKDCCRERSNQNATEGGEDVGYKIEDLGSEAQFIKKVVQAFDWFVDMNGTKYVGWAHDDDGRYYIKPVDSSLHMALYTRGMAISGDSVSPQFGKIVMQYVLGREDLTSGSNKSIFRPTRIGVRVDPDEGPNGNSLTTWIHLGTQNDGKALCAKVQPDSVTLHSEIECPVKWWTCQEYAANHIPSENQVIAKFGDVEGLKKWAKLRLFDYFNVKGDQRPLLLGIIFAMLSGRGASPIVEFVGSPSSGKSTAADFLLDLVDPVHNGMTVSAGRADLTSIKIEELVNVVSPRYLTVFDNVSLLSRAWQDKLCQLATGCVKDNRIMWVGTYTRIHAKRPIVLTALSSVVTRPDSASRKETIVFNSRSGFRVDPGQLVTFWKQDKPYLFLGLLWLLAEALAKRDTLCSQSGLEARRAWYTLADNLFYDRDQKKRVQQERSRTKSIQALESSDFALGFTAYLQDREKNGVTRMSDRATHLMNDFNNFVYAHTGTVLVIDLGPEKIKWLATPNAITKNPVGFGWELAKNAQIISDLAGWDVCEESGDQRGGKLREICKRGAKSIDDILNEL